MAVELATSLDKAVTYSCSSAFAACSSTFQAFPHVTRESVAALLDGATPLHCAALRANPAQVTHLLAAGADPTLRTAAGELPMELVPRCSISGKGTDQQGLCRWV